MNWCDPRPSQEKGALLPIDTQLQRPRVHPSLIHSEACMEGAAENLFQSFWLGGFESACQINTRGLRIDMLATTQHDVLAKVGSDLEEAQEYDHARPKNIALIRAWLAQHDIVLVGRYSEWEYYNSDHAFLAGKRGAEAVRQLQQAQRSETSRSPSSSAARMRVANETGWTPATDQPVRSPVKENAR